MSYNASFHTYPHATSKNSNASVTHAKVVASQIWINHTTRHIPTQFSRQPMAEPGSSEGFKGPPVKEASLQERSLPLKRFTPKMAKMMNAKSQSSNTFMTSTAHAWMVWGGYD